MTIKGKKIVMSAKKFYDGDFNDFDPKEYSCLKFGNVRVAKKLGHELADMMFELNSNLLLANQCLVIPSPYNFVRNAATLMALHFIDRLNELLVEANGRHAEFMTIQRKVSYVNDYGFLPKDQRKALISNDRFFFNREYVKGKLLIFIDDCKITGTHQEKLEDILEERDLKNDVIFGYYAQYSGDNPDIEARINFAGITGLSSYLDMLIGGDCEIIVRPIKFLLSRETGEFEDACTRLYAAEPDRLVELYRLAINEGYYRIPKYQQNLATLKRFFKKYTS